MFDTICCIRKKLDALEIFKINVFGNISWFFGNFHEKERKNQNVSWFHVGLESTTLDVLYFISYDNLNSIIWLQNHFNGIPSG